MTTLDRVCQVHTNPCQLPDKRCAYRKSEIQNLILMSGSASYPEVGSVLCVGRRLLKIMLSD
jgi:hypothetical protein